MPQDENLDADQNTFQIQGDEAPSGKTPEDQDEEKQVKALTKQYATARKFDDNARKQYAIDRQYASGKILKLWASSANLIGSFIDILTSFLYARDPDVSTLGAKNVGGTSADNADFAETLGIVISRLWKKARLKKAARKMLRSSLSVGPGWLKVIMTHQTRVDPMVKSQLNDLEDNLNRVAAKQMVIAEGDLEADELVVEKKNLEQLRASLQAKLEVAYRWGLAIDFVNAEDMQVSLDVGDLTDHLDGDWNANEIYVLTSELRTKFKRLTADDVKAADVYYQRKQKADVDETIEVDMGFTADAKDSGRYTKHQPTDGTDPSFARVVELWDNRDNHIKTFVVGIKRWAIEPYTPPYATTRFYPYFNLSLFEVDGDRHPQSLSGRLLKLQDEYSSKRSNARLAAERSVPGVIFDNTGVAKDDMKKIEGSVSQEYVGINPMKGDDLRKLFTEKPIPKVDPLIFNTQPVLSDMERIAGVQEALSQSVQTAKTATEAKIQQTGFTSRTSADRDTLEDLLEDLSVYTAELAIQALPIEFVIRIAGEKAFWPEGMDVEDLLTLAEVEIQAGSTGKPDEESLRQSWQVLLPLAQNALLSIQEAQATGNIPMAVAITNLIKETMRRLDERIDVEKFIPQTLPDVSQNVTPTPENSGGGTNTGKTPEDAASDANRLT